MKEILQKAMKKRKGSQKGAGKELGSGCAVVSRARARSVALTGPGPPTGPMYRLEKQTQPNVSVDLESTLENQNTLEFCLVRENSESIHQLDQLLHIETLFIDWRVRTVCMCVFIHAVRS